VMELLRGEELGKRLKRLGRFAPADVIAYLHQTALALDKTHQASIVHRDLKPENLFLTDREDGPPRVKVLDFGVAKVVAETASAGATQSIGTPLYMAPEQFNPRMHLTGAADRYALGMVAYTLLVGAAYWADEARGGNVFALAAVAIRGPYEPASVRAAQRGVALPRAFDAWFARATAADPGARFPTSSETVRALAESLGLPPPGRAPEASQVSLAGLVPLGGPALSAPLPVSGTIPVTASALITTAAPTAPSRRSRTGLLVGVGLGAFVIMAAVVGVLVHFVGSPPTPVAAVAVAAPPEPVASVRAEPAPTAVTTPVPAPTVVAVTPTASVSATAASAHLATPTARPTVKPRPAAGAPIYSRE
jgi:serine/threonine protein kinase